MAARPAAGPRVEAAARPRPAILKARPSDVPVAARALVLMLRARRVLASGGFKAVMEREGFEVVSPAERAAGALPPIDPRTRRAVRVARIALTPGILGVRCLPRALVVEQILAARGIAAELVIGVRNDGDFEAHAWTEVEGHAVGWDEPGADAWKPLARFRSGTARAILEAR